MSHILRPRLSTEPEPTVAVLIDADGTPNRSMKYILDASARYGRTIIKRAYGDWTTSRLRSWSNSFRDFAIKPMQQFQFTTGKNSTDIAMIIDALDLLHHGGINVFMLVTSDSDFTALATRIREEGITVIGVGRKTTPVSFVKGCDHFILLESIVSVPDEAEETQPKAARKTPPAEEAQKTGEILAEGRDLLIRAAKQAANADGIMPGSFLGVVLRRLDPKFTPSNYGVFKLSDFVALFPDVIEPTGEYSGVDPTYRLVTQAS